MSRSLSRNVFLILFGGVVAAFIATIALSCGSSTPAPNTSKSGDIGSDIDLYRTEPAQGVVCIVADGYQSVAIDCDWGRP